MGASYTKISSEDSKSEHKRWWKKRKKCKSKRFIEDDILQKHVKTTEDKTTYLKSNEPCQSRGSFPVQNDNMIIVAIGSSTFYIKPSYETGYGSASKILLQRKSTSPLGKSVKGMETALASASRCHKQTFHKAEVKEIHPVPDAKRHKLECYEMCHKNCNSNESETGFVPFSVSNGTMSYERKEHVNSLLDEGHSSIYSDCAQTEAKTVYNVLPSGEDSKCQFMEHLKLKHFDIANISSFVTTEVQQPLKNLKTIEESESESCLTDSMDLSSSYPNTDMYSGRASVSPRTSDDYSSVLDNKSCERYKDESKMFKKPDSPKTSKKEPVISGSVKYSNKKCHAIEKPKDSKVHHQNEFESKIDSYGIEWNLHISDDCFNISATLPAEGSLDGSESQSFSLASQNSVNEHAQCECKSMVSRQNINGFRPEELEVVSWFCLAYLLVFYRHGNMKSKFTEGKKTLSETEDKENSSCGLCKYTNLEKTDRNDEFVFDKIENNEEIIFLQWFCSLLIGLYRYKQIEHLVYLNSHPPWLCLPVGMINENDSDKATTENCDKTKKFLGACNHFENGNLPNFHLIFGENETEMSKYVHDNMEQAINGKTESFQQSKTLIQASTHNDLDEDKMQGVKNCCPDHVDRSAERVELFPEELVSSDDNEFKLQATRKQKNEMPANADERNPKGKKMTETGEKQVGSSAGVCESEISSTVNDQVNTSRKMFKIGSTKRLKKNNSHSKGKLLRALEQKVPNENDAVISTKAGTSNHLPSQSKGTSFSKSSSKGRQRLKRNKIKGKKIRKKAKVHSSSHKKYLYLKCTENTELGMTKQTKKRIHCHTCNQLLDRKNKNCSECRLLDGELGSGKYEIKTTDDSGYSSQLLSVRSSILSELGSIRSTSFKQGKKTRRQVFSRLLHLGLLEQELRRITKHINFLAHNDHNIIAVPGLQAYFDRLRNGETPSLQERMRYEWLRLMSFSSYTGGGCPVHLARNGFHHLSGNETRCFCCNVSYSNWTYTDNVEEMHRRISPNCPFINVGDESSRNISIEAGNVQNEPNQIIPRNMDNSSTSVPSQRQTVVINQGGFSFGPYAGSSVSGEKTPTTTTVMAPGFSFGTATARPNPSGFSFSNVSGATGSNQEDQSAGTAAVTGASAFHFGVTSNSQGQSGSGISQSASQQTGGADVTTQLTGLTGALTIQQSTGAQQPSDEPFSGNPVVAPTQSQKVLRQADGDSQLTVSAQQQPETNEFQQGSTTSQRLSEAPGSGAVAPQRENADLIQLGPLKHPRYSTMATRMSSFQSWPNYLNQTPRQMAYAGFFHPGVSDFARCFCCGGGLRNWEADDDPMVEHARWYPRCEYINKLKGTHFIQAVLRRHREHMAERQRQQETAQNQTSFLTPDPMSTSVAANLLEMGFPQDRAREAILTVRRLRGRSEVSVEEVMAWMLDEDTAPREEPTRTGATAGGRDAVGNSPSEPPRSRSPANISSSGSESAAVGRQDSDSHTSVEEAKGTKTDTQGATGGAEVKGNPAESKSGGDDSSSEEKEESSKENISSNKKPTKDKKAQSRKDKSKRDKQSRARKEHSPGPSEGASLLSHGDVDTKSLKAENKVLKQMQVCKICMDKYVSVTFLPCGHLVCCGNCAKNMRKCPICRKRIKGQVRTFMS